MFKNAIFGLTPIVAADVARPLIKPVQTGKQRVKHAWRGTLKFQPTNSCTLINVHQPCRMYN